MNRKYFTSSDFAVVFLLFGLMVFFGWFVDPVVPLGLSRYFGLVIFVYLLYKEVKNKTIDTFRKNLTIGVLTLAFMVYIVMSYKQFQIHKEFKKRMEIYTNK